MVRNGGRISPHTEVIAGDREGSRAGARSNIASRQESVRVMPDGLLGAAGLLGACRPFSDTLLVMHGDHQNRALSPTLFPHGIGWGCVVVRSRSVLVPAPIWWVSNELDYKRVVAFLLVWTAALYGLPYLPYGGAMFSPAVAVLDIALVFLIFKGDVRLT